ncbi:Tuberous sclerosis 2-like protein [Bulinus truncatus]|nr:Tuberous sclerosis 2-like protein [Bulinus truncatus]
MSGIGKQSQKGDENFKEKLKVLFGFGKVSTPLNLSKTFTKEIVFTPEILKEIGPESPANNRIRTIRELCEVVKHKQLEENAIEALWLQISDLLQPHVVLDNRQLALYFLQCLLEGQMPYMTIIRGHFFRLIQNLTDPSDLYHRLELFKTLSEQGKNLLYFEDKAGVFLLHCMPDVLSAGYISSFLPVILNVIKYNAAYLDEEIMSGIVKQTCMIPNRSRSDEELTKCLQVLDAVVCYSYLPSDSLYHFVAALCHTVDKKDFSEKSWELMKKLLGTYLGHSAICTMCSMLQDKSQPVDVLLLRGAIFFTGMALWGSRRVTTLKHTFTSVLPSFLQALSHKNSIVAYEVVLNIQRLVHKYGKDLNYITWEIVLDIVETLLNQMDRCDLDKKVSIETHQVITTMETLNSKRLFFGSCDRLFKIVELCAGKRPTSSVCALIDYQHIQFIQPRKENWIDIEALHKLMDRYFKGQTRTEIRKKALDVLSCVLSVNTDIYEKELIDHIVIPHFIHIGNDPDIEVKCKAVELLISLCENCQTNEFFELVLIIEDILKKPLTGAAADGEKKEETNTGSDDGQLTDIQAAVNKICELFKIKLYQAPASHCHRLYEILVSHLALHYSHLYLSRAACNIRKTIFSLLMLLRADGRTRVGLADRKPGERHVFSPYLMCQHSDDLDALGLKSPSVPGLSASQIYSVIEYEHAFKLFLSCLEIERDWIILQLVLENLTLILENKTLVLSGDGGLIDTLCGKLCAMVKDRTVEQSQKLINRPTSFTRSDFHTYVFPVLASIVTYHSYLDKHRLRELVNCLEFGLVSKCAKICVTTLRICSLEMKELMMRMLPSVLLSLSKISATIAMAIPVLAFLSSIVRIPELYANFVEDQYMSVFAIALPYTNPFKFSHYTVSLAHHVIGIWFIRCRLPFRRGFVKYIQRGLKYNVLQLFEENSIRHLSSYNQDSSERGRTVSLNEGHRRRRNITGIEGIRNDGRIPMDEKMSQFHKELTETCVDMMSRYAFGNFSALPFRSPVVEFLLKDGQSGMWVVGNKIITVTTSGGGGKSGNFGLCDNCLAIFQNSQRNLSGETKSPNVAIPMSSTRRDRRRHKSMASLGRSQTQIDSLGISLESDDASLPVRRSRDDMSLPQENSHDLFDRDDVAVQTGSSLNKEGIDSLLTESRHQISETRMFSATQCSCWCTSWAEVNIRGASGVVSWMMRIENETSGYSFYSDPSLPDITQLLAPVRCKTPDSDSIGKIDSGSLCEEEYETLHSQHFSETNKTSFPSEVDSQTQLSLQEVSSPSLKSDLGSHQTLRRTSSSPTFPSGSLKQDASDKEMSPRPIKNLDTEGSKIRPEAGDFSQTETYDFDAAPIISAIKKISEAVEKKSDLSLKLEKEKQIGGSQTNLSQKSVESNDSVFQLASTLQNKEGSFEPVPFRGRAETSSVELRRSYGESRDAKRIAQRSLSVDLEGKKRPSNLQLTTNYNQDRIETQASPNDGSNSSSLQDEVPELRQLKRRGHTISVIHSASDIRHDDVDGRSQGSSGVKDNKTGLNPSYVFLQLYHSHPLIQSQEVPLKVPETEKFRRTVDMLDHIYPYETHKIGVLYMGKGQASDEKVLLSNEYGSPRYIKFIQSLGDLISIEEAEKEKFYLGGLNPSDGKFTVTWQDESLRVIFHIATLMPNRPGDTRFTNKKSHIGNDFVTIVYNDSSEDYKSGTISGQFNFVSIIIRPLDYESNAVTLLTKEGLGTMKDIADILGHTHTKIISDLNLPLLVRQIAINCNLASMVLQRQQSVVGSPEVFASNWLERLRQIKLLKQRILEHKPEESSAEQPASPSHMWPPTGASGDSGGVYEDFTDYLTKSIQSKQNLLVISVYLL